LDLKQNQNQEQDKRILESAPDLAPRSARFCRCSRNLQEDRHPRFCSHYITCFVIKDKEIGIWLPCVTFGLEKRIGNRKNGMIISWSCPDCKTERGYAHHGGCIIERCAMCGEGQVSCDCEWWRIESDWGGCKVVLERKDADKSKGSVLDEKGGYLNA